MLAVVLGLHRGVDIVKKCGESTPGQRIRTQLGG